MFRFDPRHFSGCDGDGFSNPNFHVQLFAGCLYVKMVWIVMTTMKNNPDGICDEVDNDYDEVDEDFASDGKLCLDLDSDGRFWIQL